MAYFKISEPNHPTKWIKSIDRANGTLEFSEERTKDCFQQDSGFFADSELAYLKFHFTETYPELKYIEVDTSWIPQATTGRVVQAAQEQIAENEQIRGVEEDAPLFEEVIVGGTPDTGPM